MKRIILINDNFIIYKFNENGEPSKWININQLITALSTIAFGILCVLILIGLWKYGEYNTARAFAEYYGQ